MLARERRPYQVILGADLPRYVGADHPDRTVREVQHARAPVDDYETLGRERVERADCESEKGELNDVAHGSAVAVSRIIELLSGN